jgi:hypothetical protein
MIDKNDDHTLIKVSTGKSSLNPIELVSLIIKNIINAIH